MQSTAKMAAALKLSADDGGTALSLRKDLGKAWKLVDAGQEKVQRPIIAAAFRLAGLQGHEVSSAGLMPLNSGTADGLLHIKEE